MTSPRRIVVVGASLAGLRACEAARRFGYDGALALVGAEPHLPYDRPPLSKEFLDAGSPQPEPPQFPTAHTLVSDLGVELRLGDPATALNLEAREVVLAGDRVGFDAVLLATGAHARSLPGTEHLAGVHVLRTLDDAVAVRTALDAGTRTVVIGAGFIGSEIASAARKRGLDVTVVEALPTPLVRAVGATAGEALAGLHTRHGTDLRCGVGVEEIVGDTRVESVRLADGTVLPADLVVVGVGACPSTDWLTSSGLTLDNGVVCDPTLRADDGVYAAGDVARWHSPDFDVLLRLEHWTNAGEQASHAVQNLLDPDQATPYSHVPYFWSDWYEQRIQFVGLPVGEPTVVTGAWDAEAFSALYRDGDRLVGALTLDRRADIMKYRALIGRAATWEDGLALAEARNAATAARAAAKAS
jgi:NADPH-dependent 2,4-dienoyl-CoA reductase/sulfur reductase-like enzyme